MQPTGANSQLDRRVGHPPSLYLGTGLMIGAAILAGLLGIGATPLQVTLVATVLAVPVVVTLWQWCQPAAVSLGVATLFVLACVTGWTLGDPGPGRACDSCPLPEDEPVAVVADAPWTVTS